jgi:hypothetical protein
LLHLFQLLLESLSRQLGGLLKLQLATSLQSALAAMLALLRPHAVTCNRQHMLVLCGHAGA